MGKNKNYVGVTAGISIEEVNDILEAFQEAGFCMDSSYVPSIGFLVSEKTLNKVPVRNLRFSRFEEIPSLLRCVNGQALSVIHYNSRNLDNLSEQVERVFNEIYKGGLCQTLQLNIEWPEFSEVKKIKEMFDKMKIILQVSHKAMLGMSVTEISSKITTYGDYLDYILIDPSRGRGIEFDIHHSTSLCHEIESIRPEYSIVFAGGLRGSNVKQVLTEVIDIVKSTDFSIDAEGRLRDKLSNTFFGHDVLNVQKVRDYLQSAAEVLYGQSQESFE